MSAPLSHDPLVVNTKDGAVWRRRAVSADGRGLYAADGTCACPEFLLVPLSELAVHGIVGSADVLPVPVGPVLRSELDQARDDVVGACLARWEEEQDNERLRWALASAKRGRARLRAQVAALLEERHSTNEVLDDAVQELRARQSCPCPPADAQPRGAARLAVASGVPTGSRPARVGWCRVNAEQWNSRYAVGAAVKAYPLTREDAPLITRTRRPAWELGHGEAVVSVDGYTGGIALTHIDPFRATDTGPEARAARWVPNNPHELCRAFQAKPAPSEFWCKTCGWNEPTHDDEAMRDAIAAALKCLPEAGGA